MEIRLANNSDIPGMIALLKQVGEVHHKIRPDLFRAGAQKYSVSDPVCFLKGISGSFSFYWCNVSYCVSVFYLLTLHGEEGRLGC